MDKLILLVFKNYSCFKRKNPRVPWLYWRCMSTKCLITSQYDLTSFDVLNQTFNVSCAQAIGIVIGLRATTDAASLIFTHVVISRSTVEDDVSTHGSYRHGISMWSSKGPFTTEQFLKIMQYPQEIPPKDWHAYMLNLSQT